MSDHLDRQLAQLDDLLKLFDTTNLQAAQRAVEHQIAELNERLETTRQALAQAQAQRRRLARARLLLEDAPPAEAEPVPVAAPVEVAAEQPGGTITEMRAIVERAVEEPVGGSYLPDRRRGERRHNGNGR